MIVTIFFKSQVIDKTRNGNIALVVACEYVYIHIVFISRQIINSFT